jgi:hypothetical protein
MALEGSLSGAITASKGKGLMFSICSKLAKFAKIARETQQSITGTLVG